MTKVLSGRFSLFKALLQVFGQDNLSRANLPGKMTR